MKKLLFTLVLTGGTAAVYADATVLSGNTYRIQDTADATYTVSSVFETADWPEGIPTPSFRFDCKQTNGWEFATDNQGRLRVAKIPSLVGDGRSLTSNQYESASMFPSWVLKMPIFVAADPALGNQPMIDLCDGMSLNSQIGLNFNAVYVHEGDTVKTNLLDKIGTVFAIYGSDLGGGSFLGGGYGYGAEGKRWSRSRTQTLSTKNADSVQVDYPSEILTGNYSAFANATVRHFGHMSVPNMSGFSGDWEVFTFRCANNNTSASGIGMGDVSPYYHSGGMKIAEMIFFTEILDDEQVAKIERHLARKWFPNRREEIGMNGRTSLGWYRSAANGSSLTTTFDVPADETLELGKVTGGRKVGSVEPKVVKTGDGTLEVGDFAEYGGTVESQGGTLKFVKRAIPTSADQLAAGLFVRFDADDAACYADLVEGDDGRQYVKGITNLASGVLLDKPVAAYQDTASNRPWIVPNAIGSKSVIDFGLLCAGETRRVLRYATRAADGTYANATMPSVFTVVALVGAQSNGGHIMNNLFQRYSDVCYSAEPWRAAEYAGYWNKYGLKDTKTFSGWAGQTLAVNATSGRFFVNGRKFDANNVGFETPGYQVAAWCVPGYNCHYLGGISADGQRGNLRLGEILIWLRPLSDEELMDAQAYLAKKWLGKTLAGYRDDAKNGVAQIQKLQVTGETAIDVPAGASARIDQLTLEANLVKTGDGTLYVGQDTETKYNLVVKGGAVKVLEPQVTAQCQMAEEPALHLDASDADSFILWPKDGTNFVHRWFSQEGLGCAVNSGGVASHPWLDAENTLNGMPCVNFGAPSYSWSSSGSRPSMGLDHAYDNARSIFIVHGAQNGGNTLFGSASPQFDKNANVQVDWNCDGSNGKWSGLLSSGANANLRNGEIRVDGVLTDRTAHPDGWSLIEFHTLGGVMISALNVRQDGTYNLGGNRYCEILVYERLLSEREKVATRNYLTKKWFPSRELEALPEAVAEKRAPAKAYAADAGETNVLDPDTAELRTIEGAGTIAKTGDGTLALADFSEFEGTLDVRAGTVEVTLPPATNAPLLVTEGRIIHLDAQDEETLTHATESSTGSNVISRWASKVGGFYAIPQMHCNSKAVTNMPYYLAHDLNGYPVVNMYSESDWNGRKCSMSFVDENGASVKISKVRTAFWVLGSQEGGGLLFGGCSTNGVSCEFYRNTTTGSGQDSGGDYRQGLIGYLTTCYWPCLSAASYWVNEVKTASCGTPNVLSGGYDIVAMRLKEGVADDKTVTTSGLAFHTEKESDRGCRGRQRIGELIVYDRVLTDEEMAQMQAYLKAKWGYTQRSNVNDATVNLAAGATLVTTGNQYVATLKGAGSVDGDATVKNFTADGVTNGFAVDGTLTIAAGATIAFENLPALTEATTITVAAAGQIADAENLTAASFIGLPEKCRAKAKVDGNTLVVTVKPMRGLVMILE